MLTRLLQRALGVACLSWAAYYIYATTLIGSLLGWDFTLSDWALVAALGIAPAVFGVVLLARTWARR